MLLGVLLCIWAPLCEPAALLLRARPAWPVEGNPMTLTCESQDPKAGVQPQFRFLRNSRALGRGWSPSRQLELGAMWSEDSGGYWCEAQMPGPRRWTQSGIVQIRVHRVPVSNVSLETQPPGGRVMEGGRLVLVCLAARGTGDVTFAWYRGALGRVLHRKTQRSLTASVAVPTVTARDAGAFYCAADNGYGPSVSELVSVTVTVPAARPVLSLRVPGAPVVPGHTVELRCEAPGGSPPILYRFYHEDGVLGNRSAPSGGAASFHLSVTEEHSGNFSCEADNGRRSPRSEPVPLRVARAGPPVPTSAILEGLLVSLALAAAPLLLCCWLRRKRGRQPAGDPLRSLPRPGPQESMYLNSAAPEPQQLVYENVNVERRDEVYSLACSVQQAWQPAPAIPPRTRARDQDSEVIYSGLKKAGPTDTDYDDAM